MLAVKYDDVHNTFNRLFTEINKRFRIQRCILGIIVKSAFTVMIALLHLPKLLHAAWFV